ncbi:MAG: hypothetical protein R3314_12190 [Longimicrobiales bacterium]|nr:hypothetical protein [Longimicrobiales bacterium]
MKRILPFFVAVLAAGCGTDVSGPSSSLLSCVFGDVTQVGLGEVVQVRGVEHQVVCLEGPADGTFLYMPFHASADSAADLDVSVTGAGLAALAGPADATLEPATLAAGLRPGLTLDHGFHSRLRQREIRELEPRIRPAVGTPVALDVMGAAVGAEVPAVGELRDFNVAISCSDIDLRTGEVMYVSDHAVVYADTANPADLSGSDFEYFAATFDTLVYPVETAHFGAPTDIDGNGRSILFFTQAVNEMNPPESESVTIGFFWSGDLFPETGTQRLEACPESNHSEMFYLITPDPQGVAGVPFSLESVRDLAIPLIGHEFQHLINASRRLFVNEASVFEAPWLNEGLSHAAEELLYYEVSGLRSGRNLTLDAVLSVPGRGDSIFNRYMGSNINNFAKFLSRPDTASLMGPPDALTTRGAAWHFLRYATDRSPANDSSFFFDVVNGTTAGVENLNSVLGAGQALDWMQDWTVAVYADDLLPEIDARFEVLSWNLREIYPQLSADEQPLGRYPIDVTLLENGQTVSIGLGVGGTTFNRFDVTADGRAILHVESDGRAPPSRLRGSFLRVQ